MIESSHIRQWNQLQILLAIARFGEATAGMIGETTGLSVATISRGLAGMKEKKLIVQRKKDTGELGRRPDVFSIYGGYAYSLYFCLDGGSLQGYLLDLRGKRVARETADAAPTMDVPSFLEKLTAMAAVLKEKRRTDGSILTVSVAVPGVVNPNGIISRIPSFPNLEHAALAQQIRSALGCSCSIYNTSRLSAAGAYLRQETPVENLVYLDINLDGGIGAGIILGGALYEDRNSLAGEVGDMVTDIGARRGILTNNQGALERQAGMKTLFSEAQQLLDSGMAPELQKLLEKQDKGKLTLNMLERAASELDLGIYQLLYQAAYAWAAAIVNVCALLSPELIIAGGAIRQGNWLVEKMIRYHLSQLYHHPISLQLAKKTVDVHVMGAVHLTRRYLFETVIADIQDNACNIES